MILAVLISLLLVVPVFGQVKVTAAAGRIAVEIDGKPFTTFFIGPDAPKPYLHPLRTASGKVITRGYPMENIEGEDRDHPHHRGLWFTHGIVNNLDFWANEPSQKGATGAKGKVVLKKVLEAKGGPKSGVIKAAFEWQDLNGKGLLTEDRTTIFYAGGASRTIDFDVTFTALDQVKFGDTKEGMFAIRLVKSLEERQTGRMVSAEGAITEKGVWGKRSPWVDYAGEVAGERVGIAIFDHPSNPRHPTYWHSRAYGLFATNIFGVHDFERDKSKDGSLTLQKGEKLRFRYRVLIHPGDDQGANIAGEFQKYAQTR